MDTPLTVVDVRGTPEQMGLAYGESAAGPIKENVVAYLGRFARTAGLDRAAVAARGAAFGETTRGHFPRLAAMLDGVARGAGVAPSLIYAINARSELLYGDPACGSPGGSGAGGEQGECTSLGVVAPRSAGGRTLLAQNWDWHPAHRDVNLLLVTEDERGHRVAALAEAGMLAKAGLNSAGVGVCVNLLGCDRDGRPGGVPYHVLLRSVLEADSLSWAIRNAMRAPRSASINLLVGQAHPAGGEVIDLELVPGEAGWLHPVDGVLVHANHFEAPLPVYDTIKDWGGSSLFRSARARRLLSAYPDPLRLQDLRAVLEDHHSHPVSICRHADERDAEDDRSETIWTILMDLDVRTITLVAGPPCSGSEGTTVAI
ncbi:C45 family peptidase [Catellatospora sp. NPDC049609]|uniref:C45 family peptidase n=1 Tax=Catellatospora sp. NPDC049609 TaxID=3155505 RepID=UPI00341F352B